MSENERMAIVETEIKELKRQQEILFKDLQRHMKEEDIRWAQVVDYMARQKGFIGGTIFVVSAVWAVIGIAIHYIGR